MSLIQLKDVYKIYAEGQARSEDAGQRLRPGGGIVLPARCEQRIVRPERAAAHQNGAARAPHARAQFMDGAA